MDFIHRSYTPELLDQPHLPPADIARNLYELEVINRWLGGHAATLCGFKALASGNFPVTVCEIGCGGGDNLRAIQQNTGSAHLIVHCIGIDLNPDCIRVAQAATWKEYPQFIAIDYRKVVFDIKPDILFASLFCHHFTEEQLVDMFSWMRINARTGFFINDLHRHAFAYYAIGMLTRIFSRSYLVKNDAPLSVRRGFKKKRIEKYIKQGRHTSLYTKMEMGIPLAADRSIMTNPPVIFDTAIIGGGLAGLSLAIQLSRKGYRVILFEKEAYPFHKVCGEYISMESWDFLLQLGLPLSEWNLPRINEVTISAPNGGSITETLQPGGFGISRFKLDATLASAARSEGTLLFENTKVTDAAYERDSFHILTSAGSFRAQTVCAGFGKRSNLDVKWKRPFIRSSRNQNYVGVKYHVRGKFPGNRIALHNFSGGYCGISRIEEDRYCLCYLTLAENLRGNKQSIKEMENNILKQNPRLREVFEETECLYENPLTISQVSFAKKSQVENHVLCVGDAAGMITPLCGNGMSMALRSSKIAAACLDGFFRGNYDRERMEAGYQQQWNRAFSGRLRTGRILQHFFGNPFLSTLLIHILKPFPLLIKGLIRRTHGEKF